MRQTASSINSCLQGLYSRNLEFRQSRLIVGPMASDQNIFPTSMFVYLSGCFSTKQSTHRLRCGQFIKSLPPAASLHIRVYQTSDTHFPISAVFLLRNVQVIPRSSACLYQALTGVNRKKSRRMMNVFSRKCQIFCSKGLFSESTSFFLLMQTIYTCYQYNVKV